MCSVFSHRMLMYNHLRRLLRCKEVAFFDFNSKVVFSCLGKCVWLELSNVEGDRWWWGWCWGGGVGPLSLMLYDFSLCWWDPVTVARHSIHPDTHTNKANWASPPLSPSNYTFPSDTDKINLCECVCVREREEKRGRDMGWTVFLQMWHGTFLGKFLGQGSGSVIMEWVQGQALLDKYCNNNVCNTQKCWLNVVVVVQTDTISTYLNKHLIASLLVTPNHCSLLK